MDPVFGYKLISKFAFPVVKYSNNKSHRFHWLCLCEYSHSMIQKSFHVWHLRTWAKSSRSEVGMPVIFSIIQMSETISNWILICVWTWNLSNFKITYNNILIYCRVIKPFAIYAASKYVIGCRTFITIDRF